MKVRHRPEIGLALGHTANDAGDTVSQFLTATAHLNLTWRPLGDNKTVVRGGYNQYVDMGFLGIPGFVGKSLFSRQCEIDETAREAGAPVVIVVFSDFTDPTSAEPQSSRPTSGG